MTRQPTLIRQRFTRVVVFALNYHSLPRGDQPGLALGGRVSRTNPHRAVLLLHLKPVPVILHDNLRVVPPRVVKINHPYNKATTSGRTTSTPL